ncbi:hypothetical protein D5086_028562 [Populus alba]|uniref:Uncharacterized protein n=1 Tax=Populus alba TaxID=43335 RepID=A0ACC4AYI6_POPAL
MDVSFWSSRRIYVDVFLVFFVAANVIQATSSPVWSVLLPFMWFFYGYLKKDQFVAMVIYVIYRKPVKNLVVEPKLQELSHEHIVDIRKLGTAICSEINIVIPQLSDSGKVVFEDQIAKELAKQTQEITNDTNKI